MDSQKLDSILDTLRKANADAEAANAARWRKLAEKFPGQVPTTPAEIVDFFASEYHWTLDDIAGLDSFQKYHFVKAALERRKATNHHSGPRNTNSDLVESVRGQTDNRPDTKKKKKKRHESSLPDVQKKVETTTTAATPIDRPKNHGAAKRRLVQTQAKD